MLVGLDGHGVILADLNFLVDSRAFVNEITDLNFRIAFHRIC